MVFGDEGYRRLQHGYKWDVSLACLLSLTMQYLLPCQVQEGLLNRDLNQAFGATSL
jgi:hypothetical protein